MLVEIFAAWAISNNQAAVIFSASQSTFYIDEKCKLINYPTIKLKRVKCKKGMVSVSGGELENLLILLNEINNNLKNIQSESFAKKSYIPKKIQRKLIGKYRYFESGRVISLNAHKDMVVLL